MPQDVTAENAADSATKKDGEKGPTSPAVGARLHRSGYSEEHLDRKDYLETPWVKPDLLKARDKYRNLLFEQGTCETPAQGRVHRVPCPWAASVDGALINVAVFGGDDCLCAHDATTIHLVDRHSLAFSGTQSLFSHMATGLPSSMHGPRDDDLVCRAGEAPLWSTTIQQMSVMGVGIALHLRMTKYYFYFFTIASLIAIPTFFICYAGTRIPSDELDPLGVSKISIANVGDRTSISAAAIANYTSQPWPGLDITYTAREVSAIIMAVDFAIVWLFLLFLLFLRGRIKTMTAEV